MQYALKIICVFSVILHQNIDPKSTENPATLREARMHDFGISILPRSIEISAPLRITAKNTPPGSLVGDIMLPTMMVSV